MFYIIAQTWTVGDKSVGVVFCKKNFWFWLIRSMWLENKIGSKITNCCRNNNIGLWKFFLYKMDDYKNFVCSSFIFDPISQN